LFVPPSLPIVIVHIYLFNATTPPPVDPPGVLFKSKGFLNVPYNLEEHDHFQPYLWNKKKIKNDKKLYWIVFKKMNYYLNSGIVVLPTTIAPAFFNFSTIGQSS